MSLCNVILQPTAGFLMGDSGLWDWEGRLVGLIPKVHVFPVARAAMVARGNASVEPETWDLVAERVPSADHLLALLPVWAWKRKASNEAAFPGASTRHDLEVTTVFWDAEAGAPRAMQLDTAAIGQADDHGYAAVLDSEGKRRPGEWYDLPGLCLTPTLTWDISLPNLRHIQDPRRFDVLGNAARIVNKQRATKHEIEGHMTTIVDGWVDVAVVTAEGVTVERVIEWPTEVAKS